MSRSPQSCAVSTAKYYRQSGYSGIVGGALFLVLGAALWPRVAEERQRYATVTGTVTSSVFWPAHTRPDGECARRFRWTYAFGDSTYEARYWNQRIKSHSCEQLEAHIRAHPEGMAVRGYHDTRGAKHAFLYATPNGHVPYFLPVAGLCFLIGVYSLRKFPKDGGAERLRRYGPWYHVRPSISHGATSTLWGLAAVWTPLSVFPSAYWYTRIALAPGPVVSLQISGILATLAFAAMWFLARRRTSAYDELSVAMDQPAITRGQKVTFRITQPFRAPVRALAVRVSLEYRYVAGAGESTHVRTTVALRETHEIDKHFGAGTRLEVLTPFEVPDGQVYDVARDRSATWFAVIRVDGAGIADADHVYAIPAEDPSEAPTHRTRR